MHIRRSPPKDLIERWLFELAEQVREAGLPCDTFYEDGFLGEELVLRCADPRGLLELKVARGGDKAKGATLLLLCETAEVVLAVLPGWHKQVSRLQNARRKFRHRVERMAAQLAARMPALHKEYPVEALERLRGLIADAAPMVGVEATFRSKAGDEDQGEGEGAGKKSRGERRYRARFAARVPTELGPRAALYYAGTRSFQLVGVARQRAAQELKARGVEDASAFAIRNPAAELLPLLVVGAAGAGAGAALAGLSERKAQKQDSSWDCDGCDALDGCDVLSDCDIGDIGGCDLPDCDSCDLPDLGGCDVPDCGGCDF